MLSVLLVIGMIGFHIIEGWTYFDGFYMTLMTLSTVGYGEVHPLGLGRRVWASFLMLTGVSVFLISFALIGDLLIRLELVDYRVGRKNTGASAIRRAYGVIVLAIQRAGGSTVFNPGGDTRVEANDVIIAMGERAQLQKMARDFDV
jgi:voltage-gated potassium channel